MHSPPHGPSGLRHLVSIALLAGGLSFLAGCVADGGPVESSSRPTRPDIVVVMTDDAGYVDFGFTGAEDGVTPSIDALAARGVVCTQAYVTASVCSPSRAGMLSGRYQQRVGHEFNLNQLKADREGWGFPPEATLLPERMKAAGYQTAVLGKWHLGSSEACHPNANGVDTFVGLLAGSRSYRQTPGAGMSRRLQRNGEPIDEPEDLYLTDFLADEAVSILQTPRDRPLFMFVSLTAPHTPMHARDPAADLERGSRPTFEQRRAVERLMVAATDEAVGRIEAALRPGTLVFFLNDNGGAINNGSDNGPWRGMKGSKWEGGIRVPFIVAWDGVLQPGRRYDLPISTLDIAATAIAAAGSAATREEEPLDGVDLVPYLSGDRDDARPHEWLFWRRGVASAVRRGDWKLIRSTSNPDVLIDLANDPGETVNLAATHPEIVAELAAGLAVWESEMVPAGTGEGEVYRRNQIIKHRMETVGREAERRLP
jgi:arylsulfatase A-like enzyme